jgi:hypothetical protein
MTKTEEFIQKAKLVHGDKYNYSKVEYINNHTKVTIICPKHGEFKQQPANHLNNMGCPKCVGNIKLTTTDFLSKAKEIHGDKYDYSKVEYVGIFNHVKIICPIHGEFEQTPRQHLKGRGCYKCGGTQKYTQNEYVIKAKELHGDKYDYSKVNYLGGRKDIIIICPKHGEFKQKAGQHIHGSGCPNCAGLGFIFLSFEEAKIFVKNLNLQTQNEWQKYCKSGNKPDNIPIAPEIVYKKVWINWGDWLGTFKISNQKKEYWTFEEARIFVRNLNLKSITEWKRYCKNENKPSNIPNDPYGTYNKYGWLNWGDFLGSFTLAPKDRQYLSFEEARNFVRTLNLNSKEKWVNYCKSGSKPNNIPNDPYSYYKDDGWIDMGDWLGTFTIAPRYKQLNYLSEEEFIQFIKDTFPNLYGAELHKAYEAWWDENKPEYLPKDVAKYYNK